MFYFYPCVNITNIFCLFNKYIFSWQENILYTILTLRTPRSEAICSSVFLQTFDVNKMLTNKSN